MKLKNNTFFHRSFLAIVLTLFSLQLYGQIVFEENFNLPEGTTSGTADGVNWSSSCPTCLNGDHWEVKSGVFEGKDTNGEAVWTTDTPIDISACGNIEISFDINSIGTMEGCGTDCNSVDWVRFQYNIDGTGWIDPANSYYCSGTCAGINVVSSDDTPFTNYSTGCIPTGGSSLQLRISVQCWAGDEAWQIDNIKVSCGSANAGENAVLNTCSGSPATDLFNQLGGNPINGGTWSGPSNLSGGDAGTFDPATMNEGTYTYTVGNSPCRSSDNVVGNFVSSGNAGNDATIEICNASPSLDLFDVLGGSPQNNGVWSGPSNLSGGDAGTFDPATMNEGTYTYTVGNSPCQASANVVVNFVSSGNAGNDATIEICNTSPSLNLFDVLGGSPQNNGVWSGPSNLSGGDAGTFDPATMNEGTYIYTVGNSPCQASANVVVNFVSSGNAGNDATIEICNTSPSLNLFDVLGGAPQNNGVWSGPSNLSGGDAGTFDPATMNEGTYTYTVGNSPCQASANVVVNFVSSGNAGNDATIE